MYGRLPSAEVPLMSEVLPQLVKLLSLERLEENLFRGDSQDLGWGQVFGGQVLGQALSAAAQTVPPERVVHSFHGYFLLRGSVDRPIVYDVDRIRDGRSFTTRRVVAVQRGHAIFSMSASFQVVEEGFEHQDEMPELPGPEGLPSQMERWRRVADRIPSPMREQFTAEWPIEIRPIDPINALAPTPRPPQSASWLRSNGGLPDDPAVHQYLLAYASDFNFLNTSMYPHGVSWLSGTMQVASLDHAMWFHRPFRMDEWILQVVNSPSASGARGLVQARFFTRDGRLVASTAQEGLIRKRG
ncbi:MAG TPA: acyl-CoA thioesterase II [Myxococcaceae bacterium]|nr:acyl-CoA thioesterase II [Myxococcaceae bacterium]